MLLEKLVNKFADIAIILGIHCNVDIAILSPVCSPWVLYYPWFLCPPNQQNRMICLAYIFLIHVFARRRAPPNSSIIHLPCISIYWNGHWSWNEQIFQLLCIYLVIISSRFIRDLPIQKTIFTDSIILAIWVIWINPFNWNPFLYSMIQSCRHSPALTTFVLLNAP